MENWNSSEANLNLFLRLKLDLLLGIIEELLILDANRGQFIGIFYYTMTFF